MADARAADVLMDQRDDLITANWVRQWAEELGFQPIDGDAFEYSFGEGQHQVRILIDLDSSVTMGLGSKNYPKVLNKRLEDEYTPLEQVLDIIRTELNGNGMSLDERNIAILAIIGDGEA